MKRGWVREKGSGGREKGGNIVREIGFILETYAKPTQKHRSEQKYTHRYAEVQRDTERHTKVHKSTAHKSTQKHTETHGNAG